MPNFNNTSKQPATTAMRILAVAVVASTLTFSAASTASAENFVPYDSEQTLGQAAKRVFRLGNRGWRVLALSATIGTSAVEAHANGYDAEETAGRIVGDIGNEVASTLGDAAYVGGYALKQLGNGVVGVINWLAD